MKKLLLLILLFSALLVAFLIRLLSERSSAPAEETHLIGEAAGAPSAQDGVVAGFPPSAAELLRAPAALSSSPDQSSAVPEAMEQVNWQEVQVRTVNASGEPVMGIPVGFGWSAERARS